ncbi:uncharacterized protein Bfra_007907 [Botrytis fragariae]|uniref:2EXR domain-containing protein n=1 Tax=Botrytis fragariae TaxID=1964551 RepID=A0A8H6APF5_9HELO|nr:uncharacterized protein Bfra_007907 [Botrytis fragariae]KAF5871391.1 hypothetical protein Bfra_007907 [Botrytis fragariae]
MHKLLPRLYSSSDIQQGDHDDPSSPTITQFHLFPSIPTELRYKIWHLAILPRVLEPSLDFPNDEQKAQYPRRRPPPALFFTTHESRLICLDEYIVQTFRNKPFYIHHCLDTLFLPISNRISKDLSRSEPFYCWLISQISTLALEISIDPALLNLRPSSKSFRVLPPRAAIIPSLDGYLWMYSLTSPSTILYLTFQLSSARPRPRSTPPPQSPSSLEPLCSPSSPIDQYYADINQYADRTIITEYKEDCETNMPWSKLLPKPKLVPDPMAIIRRQQMALRLESERMVTKNVSYRTHKVLRE